MENACWNSAFRNPGTINCLETISYIFWFYNLYSQSILILWFLDFKTLNLSMRFPLEFDGRFGWFQKEFDSFGCWFRCIKSWSHTLHGRILYFLWSLLIHPIDRYTFKLRIVYFQQMIAYFFECLIQSTFEWSFMLCT